MQHKHQQFVARLIHFRSMLIALMFGVGFLYFSSNVVGDVDIALSAKIAFLVVALVASIFAVWYVSHRAIYVPVPVMITAFTYGLLFFIDPPLQKTFFVLGATVIFYLTLLGIIRDHDNPSDATAKSFLSIGLIVALFLFYSVSYGVYINYDIPLWLFLLVGAFVIFILSTTSLRLYSESMGKALLYSGVLTCAMVQLMWMENFWPFNYLTMAMVNLMFYYILWDMMQSAFTDNLSKRRTSLDIGIIITLLLMILLSTQWTRF